MLALILFRVPADSGRMGYYIIFRSFTVLLFAVYLLEINIWVGVFLYSALISTFYPVSTKQTYLALDYVVLGVGFYTILMLRCNDFEKVMNYICIAVLVHCIFIIVKVQGVDPWRLFVRVYDGNNLWGVFGNRNEASTFIALGSISFYRRPWSFCFPILILGLMSITSGLGGVLGFGTGVFIYLLINTNINNIHYLCITSAIGVWALVYYAVAIDYNPVAPEESRLRMWKKVYPFYKQYWKMGFGLGEWINANGKLIRAGVIEPGWKRLHNTFIQGIVEMGIPYLICLSGYTVNILRRIKRHPFCLVPMGVIFIVTNVNSVFQMNAINGMMILFLLAYINSKLRGRNGMVTCRHTN